MIDISNSFQNSYRVTSRIIESDIISTIPNGRHYSNKSFKRIMKYFVIFLFYPKMYEPIIYIKV